MAPNPVPSSNGSVEPVVEIGALPGRKSKAISILTGTVLYPVAYFRDDESYERFRAAVGQRSRLKWEDEDA